MKMKTFVLLHYNSIFGMCFDTSIFVLLERLFGHGIFYLACRHHVVKVMAGHVAKQFRCQATRATSVHFWKAAILVSRLSRRYKQGRSLYEMTTRS